MIKYFRHTLTRANIRSAHSWFILRLVSTLYSRAIQCTNTHGIWLLNWIYYVLCVYTAATHTQIDACVHETKSIEYVPNNHNNSVTATWMDVDTWCCDVPAFHIEHMDAGKINSFFARHLRFHRTTSTTTQETLYCASVCYSTSTQTANTRTHYLGLLLYCRSGLWCFMSNVDVDMNGKQKSNNTIVRQQLLLLLLRLR